MGKLLELTDVVDSVISDIRGDNTAYDQRTVLREYRGLLVHLAEKVYNIKKNAEYDSIRTEAGEVICDTIELLETGKIDYLSVYIPQYEGSGE